MYIKQLYISKSLILHQRRALHMADHNVQVDVCVILSGA